MCVCFVYIYPLLALIRRHKPFLALLGDHSLIPIFLLIEVPANRTKVTYRASLGKPIVPLVFFHMKRNENALNDMEEGT